MKSSSAFTIRTPCICQIAGNWSVEKKMHHKDIGHGGPLAQDLRLVCSRNMKVTVEVQVT